MLDSADAAMVRATAEAYRNALLKAGNLKRLSKAQRQALTEAHSQFFSLVEKLTGPHHLHDADDGEEQRSWQLLTSVLAKKDPDWHTRGQTGVAAAIASIVWLTSPKQ